MNPVTPLLPAARFLPFLLLAGVLPCHAQSPALITGQDNGGTVVVNAFRPNGTAIDSFFGGQIGFTGGMRIGTGDVNGDGAPDIITGEGVGGGLVRVYTGPAHTLTTAVGPFGGSYALGVHVAGGDVNRDGRADIIAGAVADIGAPAMS